jgi:hypothetical protein
VGNRRNANHDVLDNLDRFCSGNNFRLDAGRRKEEIDPQRRLARRRQTCTGKPIYCLFLD